MSVRTKTRAVPDTHRRSRRDFLARTLALAGTASLADVGPAAAARPPAATSGRGGYDYVVIGTGSAGSVLIRRLVDAGYRVLALEAGPPDRMRAIHVPSMVGELYGSKVDWQFMTAPQVHAGDQAISWPRGKTFGGSSAINGMMYVRGLPDDFDKWAREGAAGWAWKDVEPWFRKLENFRLPDLLDVHGYTGPLQIGRPEMTPLARDCVAAAIDGGLPARDDYNDGRDSTGAALSQMTVLASGLRGSAWTCYVEPILGNPRLTVLTDARVLRVLVERNRATGVQFLCKSEVLEVRVEREVLLSAGSIMSPAILMHSGIGPAALLSRAGVRTVVDVPGVGENLHDQLACWTVWQTARPNAQSVTTGMEATLFVKSDASLAGPDGQILLSTNTFPLAGYPTVTQGFTLVPTALAPRSRGRVTIDNDDPLAFPRMDPRVCADPADAELVAELALYAREVVAQTRFATWGAREVAPGPSVSTRAAMADYVRRTASSASHQVGTARMGVDELAVVDPELRVRGVACLRVVDESVMPVVTSGNTNAPTIMIAERAVDLILARERRSETQGQA